MSLGVRTNVIFQDAVHAVLDLEIDGIERSGGRFGDRRLARVFGGEAGVLRELKRVREWNGAAEHYEVGAYHNALLHSFVGDGIEGMAEELLVFGNGRYRVQRIEVAAFEEAFFPDLDFALPRDDVNAFGAGEKFVLGLDGGVFGVANALPPHPKELRGRPCDPKAVESIAELSEAQEAVLRRRHQTDKAAVWRDIEAMGGVLYQRGKVFPYFPDWLVPA